MPPLKGIQHAAMVLYDGSIPETDFDQYMKVFRPKAAGCWLLHEATLDMDLDHFISYSSISAVYGNPGQVSYVGANSFLDNFSHWRRAQGLPATTINWGVIGDVGFVARNWNVLIDACETNPAEWSPRAISLAGQRWRTQEEKAAAPALAPRPP